MKIKNYFGSLAVAYRSANIADWQQAGIGSKDVIKWFDFKKTVRLNEYLKKLNNFHIGYICYGDDEYPKYLAEIHCPPIVLYYIGNTNLLKRQLIAVVGTRRLTTYGKKVANELVKGLVDYNFVVVSGLALGIDGIAHAACLAQGGDTIAVHASGLDKIYPMANQRLSRDIVENNGLLLSENKIGGTISKWQFPARNRIISGLSVGVLVVEAPVKSGALITANYALEQNRLVMAIPSDIFSLAGQGTNQLIANGACMVTKIDDVLNELGVQKKIEVEKNKIDLDNDLQEKLISLLSNGSKMFDEMVVELSLPANQIAAELNILIIKGYVGEEGGGRWYCRV
ncbi:MAG TPA: DNA-processing protein DprA [bacterium]|nr:DNA-processing protein DprA [bacterium]